MLRRMRSEAGQVFTADFHRLDVDVALNVHARSLPAAIHGHVLDETAGAPDVDGGNR